jgi:hypothetical protein
MDSEPTTSLDPEQQLRTIRIIWTALFVSPLLLMGVMHFVRSSSDTPSEGSAQLLMPLLACNLVLAVVAPLAGRVVEMTHVRNARAQQSPPNPLTLLTMVTILRAALGEGAALFAAVTYFLTGSPLTFVPFGIALAAMLWARPTDERVDSFQRELGGHF